MKGKSEHRLGFLILYIKIKFNYLILNFLETKVRFILYIYQITITKGRSNKFKHYKGCPCQDCKDNGHDKVRIAFSYLILEQLKEHPRYLRLAPDLIYASTSY